VTFSGSNGPICRTSLDESSPDTASCSYTYIGPLASPDSVTASYGGDSNYASSASAAQSISVNQDPTTTSMPTVTDTTSGDPANPAVVGESVTFSSSVAVTAPGVGPATATVTFADGSGTLCTATLDGTDTATCPYTYPHATSEDDVVATYGGDTKDAGSSSAALDEVVNAASTSTSLGASPASPVTGQQVTLTATVAPEPPGSGTPTGSVTFSDSGGTLCSAVALNAGSPDTATCDVTYPQAGMDTVTASYAGTADFAASSGSVGVTSGLGATQTALQSSDNPASSGEAPTFTATVRAMAPASGTPDGTVTFSFSGSGGGTAPGCTGGDTVNVVAGVATCTLSAGLEPKQSPITVGAQYSGSAAFSASAASPVTETVGMASTSVTVTSSANPVASSSAVSFKAKVAVAPPAGGTPGGTITWTITTSTGKAVTCSTISTVVQATLKSTCTIAAGRLSSTKSPYTVKAVYSGSTKFDGSTGTLSETVS
jgi:hypothetical protein